MSIFKFINDTIDRWIGNDRKENYRQGKTEVGIRIGTEGITPIYRPGTLSHTSARMPGKSTAFLGNTNHSMTKAEIMDYNQKHPNEIAGDIK